VHVHQALNQTQQQSKAVLEFHRSVHLLTLVQRVTCVLLENATCHAMTQALALLANAASTVSVRKFATQTTIAYREKFATMVEFVFLAVIQMSTVLTRKFAFNQNANAEKDLSQHHSDAVILTSAQKNLVIKQQFVRTSQDHTSVNAQKTLLEMDMENWVARNQTNATRMLIVKTTYHAQKENALILARLKRAVQTQFVK
jgi:hypothetical protein